MRKMYQYWTRRQRRRWEWPRRSSGWGPWTARGGKSEAKRGPEPTPSWPKTRSCADRSGPSARPWTRPPEPSETIGRGHRRPIGTRRIRSHSTGKMKSRNRERPGFPRRSRRGRSRRAPSSPCWWRGDALASRRSCNGTTRILQPWKEIS